MGAAFEVYNYLGYGMAEEIYQQNLEIELRRGARVISAFLTPKAFNSKAQGRRYSGAPWE